MLSVFLLIVGLLFAALGQFYFSYRRVYVWDGVLFWAIAVYSFGLLLWRTTRQQRGERVRRPVSRVSVRELRVLGAIGGMGIAFLAGGMARQSDRIDFRWPFWLWLTGMGCFLLSFALPAPLSAIKGWQQRLLDWFHRHWREVAGLTLLLLAALLVRAFDLEHIPANLGGDEGTQGVAALKLLGPPLGNPFAASDWFSVPTMSYLAYGVSMRIFGESVAGLRALSALAGTLTVLTTFLLARELWGRRAAWLAATALTCAHTHVHFSRLGSNQILDGLFMTLSLWLLVRALRLRRAIYFALAGLVIGLGWYAYFGARLVGIVVACYLVWRVVVEYRFLHRHRWLLVILLAAALVAVAPLMLHYARHPDALASRARQVSIFASGWLEREQVITGRSAASLLLQQFAKSISAFNFTLDPTFWYYPAIPTLDLISGVFFILGMVWALAHCRWPNNGLLLIWFWLALITGWVMTENPPSSQRMTVLSPALALLVALGLKWLIELSLRVFELSGEANADTNRYLRNWIVGMFLVAMAILNLRYYFLVYTPTRVYGNPTAEIATELSRYLEQQQDDLVIYFHGPNQMYWDFGTVAFMAQGVKGVNVPPLADGELQIPVLDGGARFVILADRLGELDLVRERYPNGEEMHVYSRANNRLLYVLYTVERE